MTLKVFEDRDFELLHSRECTVPGYLVLWPKPAVHSLADLPEAAAARLGTVLRDAVAAINDVVEAERVYVLCLAELEPRIHFHLFPRTATATASFRDSTGYAATAINGLQYLQWARDHFAWPEDFDTAEIQRVLADIRARLNVER